MILWNGTFLRFRAFKGEFLHCEDVRSLDFDAKPQSKWSRSQQLTVERFNGKGGQVFKERSPQKRIPLWASPIELSESAQNHLVQILDRNFECPTAVGDGRPFPHVTQWAKCFFHRIWPMATPKQWHWGGQSLPRWFLLDGKRRPYTLLPEHRNCSLGNQSILLGRSLILKHNSKKYKNEKNAFFSRFDFMLLYSMSHSGLKVQTQKLHLLKQ